MMAEFEDKRSRGHAMYADGLPREYAGGSLEMEAPAVGTVLQISRRPAVDGARV